MVRPSPLGPRGVAVAVAALVATSTLAAPGRADATMPRGPQRGHAAFEGTCELTGTVVFRPSLTVVPARGSGRARAVGTCSGTLVTPRGESREVRRVAARYDATNASEQMSCGGAVATGQGRLRLAGRTIGFRLDEYRVGATSVLDLAGRRTGSATGVARVAESADPASIAGCASGGLTSAPIVVTLRTLEPLG